MGCTTSDVWGDETEAKGDGKKDGQKSRRVEAQNARDMLHKFQDQLKITKGQRAAYHQVFANIDKDNSGSISLKEFGASVGKPSGQDVFLMRMFRQFDTNTEGRQADVLDSIELFVGYYGFCALPGGEYVLKYVFDLYDPEREGVIAEAAYRQMCKEVMGSKATEDLVDELVLVTDRDGDGEISFCEFRKATRKLTEKGKDTVYLPAVELQRRMRELAGFNDHYWKTECKRVEKVLATEDLWNASELWTKNILKEAVDRTPKEHMGDALMDRRAKFKLPEPKADPKAKAAKKYQVAPEDDAPPVDDGSKTLIELRPIQHKAPQGKEGNTALDKVRKKKQARQR